MFIAGQWRAQATLARAMAAIRYGDPGQYELMKSTASAGYAQAWGVGESLIYRARVALGLGTTHGGKRVRSGRRPTPAPPLALLNPDDMGIAVQVVGTGMMKTLIITLDHQPMHMVSGTLVIVEVAVLDEITEFLLGVTIEDAMRELALTNRSIVKLRKFVRD